ncbi:hypothetical protein DET49_102167 [Salegentibacter sp. 24]|jgi:hypothetical protein|uniref:hypothetical protein n=1 Tax=Salegentibacter sp. 24 TaxID=2183986 RepID=UPI00106034B3|nr:hypothetical protein [Salegentibacter sp. 24]TDN95282.1 hypothetical protein DET49_102167 [Salegentibacter sp. 24]
MKNSIKYFGFALMMAAGFQAHAQEVEVDVEVKEQSIWDRDLPNFREPDQRGINEFEAPKDKITYFDGVQVRVGGASTIQFQDLDHENAAGNLPELEGNFNLATANLDLDVLLYDGVRMHLRTYLSSQHHTEAYVKGGYIQIDELNFISEGFASGLMNHLRFKIGHMENNYGDAHFRRTDNAMALYNPFVGNYLMDSFTTEVGAEVYMFNGPWLGMLGFTNGKLNQSTSGDGETDPSFLAKVGYDNQLSEDLRFRLTGSLFHSGHNYSRGNYLYTGDRAGSRYYNVMTNADGGDGFRAGRIAPSFKNEMTSFMINPFIKFGGLEFFGIYETTSGKDIGESDTRNYTQLSGELIYRFGVQEDFYFGGRYNTVNGEMATGEDISVNRFQLGAGWFMTKNILAKLEYVNQEYNDYPTGDIHAGGQFNGITLEAAISF